MLKYHVNCLLLLNYPCIAFVYKVLSNYVRFLYQFYRTKNCTQFVIKLKSNSTLFLTLELKGFVYNKILTKQKKKTSETKYSTLFYTTINFPLNSKSKTLFNNHCNMALSNLIF